MSLNTDIEMFLPEKVMFRFSIEILLTQSTKKLGRGTLLCSTKILVSKKNMEKSEGGRDCHVFLSNNFVSQC